MYALIEMNEDGTISKVLKESYSLLDLSHASFDGESYPAVFVSREDLLSVLEEQIEDNEKDESLIEKKIDEMWGKVSVIPEEDMIRLALKLGESLVENGGFWDYLDDWLDERGFTVKEDDE